MLILLLIYDIIDCAGYHSDWMCGCEQTGCVCFHVINIIHWFLCWCIDDWLMYFKGKDCRYDQFLNIEYWFVISIGELFSTVSSRRLSMTFCSKYYKWADDGSRTNRKADAHSCTSQAQPIKGLLELPRPYMVMICCFKLNFKTASGGHHGAGSSLISECFRDYHFVAK